MSDLPKILTTAAPPAPALKPERERWTFQRLKKVYGERYANQVKTLRYRVKK